MSQFILNIENLNKDEEYRVADTLDTLTKRDVLMMKNGSATLHFDSDGTLQEIEFKYKRWKRRKSG